MFVKLSSHTAKSNGSTWFFAQTVGGTSIGIGYFSFSSTDEVACES